MAEGPPSTVFCATDSIRQGCGKVMLRDWQADAPMLDTSKCRDASDIPLQHQVRSQDDGGKSGARVEREFQEEVRARRKQIRDAGGQRGSIRQTHSVPTHLYHGKIRETGDKAYWDDPSNLARHKECKVE